MFTESPSSNFIVDVHSDPMCLRIKGRANYLNCAPLNDFFNTITQKNNITLMVDLAECTGMDSTFLGLLAGVALEFKKQDKKSTIYLTNVSNRNLESIENLGLNLILKVNPSEYASPSESRVHLNTQSQFQSLNFENTGSAEMILKAHQNLIHAQPSNLYKFQDVISFLKNQITQDN